MKIRKQLEQFNNPISEQNLNRTLSILDIQDTDTILDIGGGNGAVLAKMLSDNKANGILVELDKEQIEECKLSSALLFDSGQLKIVHSDAIEYLKELSIASIDCFISIGSSYIFGGFENLIKQALPYLKKGGFLLVGDEYWHTKPSADYLEILGANITDSRFHYENIALGEKLGLTYLYSQVASEEDWNNFEGKYFLMEELKAAKFSKKDKEEKLKNLRKFRQAQFKEGRKVMGFGLYLFQYES